MSLHALRDKFAEMKLPDQTLGAYFRRVSTRCSHTCTRTDMHPHTERERERDACNDGFTVSIFAVKRISVRMLVFEREREREGGMRSEVVLAVKKY